MKRPGPISGFPEWLPEQRMVEQRVLDILRTKFELHGFAPVETRAVEPLEQLLAKGETDKEIYVLRRLHASDDEGNTGLGLHYDLTVPFARYTVEHEGKLQFPLRRYQIQRAWRGERPQEGRFREFLQADFDVINRNHLPFYHDIELPVMLADIWSSLPFPSLRLLTNNRKIAEGFYGSIGIKDIPTALRTVDKLDKLGGQAVLELLKQQVGCTEEQAKACLDLSSISTTDGSFVDRVRALGASDPLMDEGLHELTQVVDAVNQAAPGLIVADMRVARGFDYYTGTVYEGLLVGHEGLGAVCSGGRYDNLASAGESLSFPGVGLSIGITRILARLFNRGLLQASRRTPTCVLVALANEEDRSNCNQLAACLRSRGVPTEVAPDPVKYGKQIRHAERHGIPYVWFPHWETEDHEVRDIRSGVQEPADPNMWLPPSEDLGVIILTDHDR